MSQIQTLKTSLRAINFWPTQFPTRSPQDLRHDITETLPDLDVVALQVLAWIATALLLLRLE